MVGRGFVSDFASRVEGLSLCATDDMLCNKWRLDVRAQGMRSVKGVCWDTSRVARCPDGDNEIEERGGE